MDFTASSDSSITKCCLLCCQRICQTDNFVKCPKCHCVYYCSLSCHEEDLKNQDSNNSHSKWCSKLLFFAKNESKLVDKFFPYSPETSSLDFDTQRLAHFLMQRGLFGHGFWRRECNLWMDFHCETLPLPGELNTSVDPFVLPEEGVLLESNESPNGCCPMDVILSSWELYYYWRGFQSNSVICVLMQWPLLVYHILFNSLPIDHNTYYQSLMLKKSLCIHLVGVEKEVELIPCFVELRHLMPTIDINIVMIGNQISSSIHNRIYVRPGFKVQTVKGLYHEVAKSLLNPNVDQVADNQSISLPQPDLIILPNAGIAAYVSWMKTIEFLMKLNVHSYVTDFSEFSMEMSSEIIDRLNFGTLTSPRINPFRSPLRVVSEQHDLPSYSNAFISELVFPL